MPFHAPARRTAMPLLAIAACAMPLLSPAQVTLKPDGKTRYLFTAGANASRGNSESTALNLSLETARVTSYDKLTFLGKAAYARNDGATTTERFSLGSQYNRDFSPRWFGFGSGELLRDELANISLRYSLAGGVGRHMIQSDTTNFDLSAGVGYTHDRYVDPAFFGGQFRESYGRPELVLAEESNHVLSSTTSLRQRLGLYPSLRSGGDYRATFDSSISVAMTETMNLTAGLQYRYTTDPGAGLKKGDLAFVTGVSWRFD